MNTIVKRFVATATATVAVVAGSIAVAPAVSAAESTPVSMSVVAAQPAAMPALSKKDKKFIRYVTSETPSLKAAAKKDVIGLAKATCQALRADVHPYDVIDVYLDNGFSDDETTTMIAGSVVFYCPDMEYLFDE